MGEAEWHHSLEMHRTWQAQLTGKQWIVLYRFCCCCCCLFVLFKNSHNMAEFKFRSRRVTVCVSQTKGYECFLCVLLSPKKQWGREWTREAQGENKTSNLISFQRNKKWIWRKQNQSCGRLKTRSNTEAGGGRTGIHMSLMEKNARTLHLCKALPQSSSAELLQLVSLERNIYKPYITEHSEKLRSKEVLQASFWNQNTVCPKQCSEIKKYILIILQRKKAWVLSDYLPGTEKETNSC